MVGVLPALLLVAALTWQLALAGHAAWQCAHAARAGARAAVVGEDAEEAARSALSESLEEGLEVDSRGDGAVRVEVRIPLVVRDWGSPVSVAATAALGAAP